MSAALIVFPLEKTVCFLCLGEFNRRENEDSRRFCPECTENLRQIHETAEDCHRILRESVQSSGGDVSTFDHAIAMHMGSMP